MNNDKETQLDRDTALLAFYNAMLLHYLASEAREIKHALEFLILAWECGKRAIDLGASDVEIDAVRQAAKAERRTRIANGGESVLS